MESEVEEDAFSGFRSNSLRIVTIVNLTISMTLALFVYFTMILYERYGGDPMKRSIANRIIIQIIFSVLVYMFVTQPLRAIAILYGPIAPWAAKIAICTRIIPALFALLGFSEIIIMRNLMIFGFARMSQVNDDFMATFITMWNSGFVIAFVAASAYLNAMPEWDFKFLTGQETVDEELRHNGYFFAFVILTSTIIIVGSLITSIKKIIEYRKDQNTAAVHTINIGQGSPPGFNNQSVNPPIIPAMMEIGIAVITVGLIIAVGVANSFARSLIESVHPISLSNYFSAGNLFIQWTIIPLCCLIFNEKYRRYLSQDIFA